MKLLILLGLLATTATTPLTAAEEDGYFDLDKPFVTGRAEVTGFDLLAAPDNAANCAKARKLTAYDQDEVTVLSGYVQSLADKGRRLDSLLPFYLSAGERLDHDAVNESLECASDGKRSDIEALAAHAAGLIDALPPQPATTGDLAAARALITRDVYLDEAVMTIGLLRDDPSPKSPAVQALIGRLNVLDAERLKARELRIDALGRFEDPAAGDALLKRQIMRSLSK